MPDCQDVLDLKSLIPLIALPSHLPPRADGKPWSIPSVYRWTSRGVGGRKLATVTVGGTKYVAPSDLAKFIGITTNDAPTTPHGKRARDARKARVDRELAELGILD